MTQLTENEAVTEFAASITPLLRPLATGKQILDACLDFYRDTRVIGTDDSMMLEFGIYQRLISKNLFYDSRRVIYDCEFSTEEYPELRIARQLFADRGDDDTCLSVNISFDIKLTDSVTKMSGMYEWWGLEKTSDQVSKFVNEPFVAELLSLTPDYGYACATEIG